MCESSLAFAWHSSSSMVTFMLVSFQIYNQTCGSAQRCMEIILRRDFSALDIFWKHYLWVHKRHFLKPSTEHQKAPSMPPRIGFSGHSSSTFHWNAVCAFCAVYLPSDFCESFFGCLDCMCFPSFSRILVQLARDSCSAIFGASSKAPRFILLRS